ncbi:hypothetical protein FLP10_10185 [Agromyces intestinalis]|uniref:Uncharacterized protein n=1 Tax=Agromyces intestinalis TaxID=2592652 RepID=A0A5C1YF90_9MICO|nr:hypothetical protein FLP10_10185 [Agromyces intestinalis]
MARHPNSPGRTGAGREPVGSRRVVSLADGDGLGVPLVPSGRRRPGRGIRRGARPATPAAPALLVVAAASALVGVVVVAVLIVA